MPPCPSCKTENQPQAQFCEGCGRLLTTDRSSLGLIDAGIVCPACDTYNEPYQKLCTGCGQSLSGLSAFLEAVPELPMQPAAEPAAAEPRPSPVSSLFETLPAEPEMGAAAQPRVQLRLLRGSGEKDATFPLGPDRVTIGRRGSGISIANDPYLSPLHLSLRFEGGRLVAEDLQSLNGTFLRSREWAELRQGSEFITGEQRLVLLGLGGPILDKRIPASSDTRAQGGPLSREPLAAFRLLHAEPDGKARAGAVMLRAGPVISVGQSDCDINFPKDTLMSPRQVELHMRSSSLQVVETGSSSGVFIRISEPTPLVNGDEIMVGDEVFRVEMSEW